MAVGGVVVACCGLGVIAAAIGGHGSPTTTTNGGTSNGSNTSTSHGPAKVGDTITASGISCTLVSAKTIPGDDFMKPKDGNVFVQVHVKLVNKSSSEFHYYPVDFHGKGGSGNITDAQVIATSIYKDNQYLDSGTLAAGGSVEGDVIIEVPQGDHRAELTWSPSIFDNSTDNAWNLGL